MRKPKKKQAKPTETEIQVTVTRDAGEFIDSALAKPLGYQITPEELQAVDRALGIKPTSENSKIS